MMVAIENFICSLVKMSARYILANTDIIKKHPQYPWFMALRMFLSYL